MQRYKIGKRNARKLQSFYAHIHIYRQMKHKEKKATHTPQWMSLFCCIFAGDIVN